MSELGQLGRDVLAVPVVGRPIVHAVKIDAGRKDVGVARQSQCGEVATVAAAPQAYPSRIDVCARLQIFSGGNHVLVFAGAAARAAGGFAKCAAVADPAAVIHGEDHVAAAGKILVHTVGIRVVVHVVP